MEEINLNPILEYSQDNYVHGGKIWYHRQKVIDMMKETIETIIIHLGEEDLLSDDTYVILSEVENSIITTF